MREFPFPLTPNTDFSSIWMAIRRQGRQVVFLLDEAQAMPEESIEALRLPALLGML